MSDVVNPNQFGATKRPPRNLFAERRDYNLAWDSYSLDGGERPDNDERMEKDRSK